MPRWERNRIHPRLLDQDKIWVDKDGNEHQLTLMGETYVRNVRDFLLRKSTQYRNLYRADSRMHSMEWMKATRLYRRIDEMIEHPFPDTVEVNPANYIID